MYQPAVAAIQAVAYNQKGQSFLVTVRAVGQEMGMGSKPPESPKASSFADDSMTDKQRTLIIQLISSHFFDSREREREFAKVAGFSKSDADAYIKSLINV